MKFQNESRSKFLVYFKEIINIISTFLCLINRKKIPNEYYPLPKNPLRLVLQTSAVEHTKSMSFNISRRSSLLLLKLCDILRLKVNREIMLKSMSSFFISSVP